MPRVRPAKTGEGDAAGTLIVTSEVRDEIARAKSQIADVSAATPPQTLLPKPRVTRDNTNANHHLISEADLVRLEHAVNGSLSSWFQVFFGAILGNSLQFASALYVASKSGVSSLSNLDITSVLLMIGCLSAGAMCLIAQSGRKKYTVAGICTEIRKRDMYIE